MLSRTRKAVSFIEFIVLLIVVLLLGLIAASIDVAAAPAAAAVGLVLVASFAAATLHSSGYRRAGRNTIRST